MASLLRPLVARLGKIARLTGALAALAVAAPLPALAQDDAAGLGTLRFDEAGALALTSPWGPADVGRLKGTFLALPNQPHANLLVDLYCIDILHAVTFDPNGWTVRLTNLGGDPTLDYTRQGSRYAASDPSALTRYRKAAWLVDQYATVSTLTDTTGIQGAMWLQFESSIEPYGYANVQEQFAVTSWVTAADAFAASAGWTTYDWSRFTIVTDVNAVGVGNGWQGTQELITKTPLTTTAPEPATFALLGAGLAVIGTVARRRGRTQTAG